jgi:hypothetical protein
MKYSSISFVIVTALITCACNSNEIGQNASFNDSTQNAIANTTTESNTRSDLNEIPGFSFETLNKKLRGKGFSYDQNCMPDETGKQSCEWNYERNFGTDNYNVTLFGSSKSQIEQVEIIATYDKKEESFYNLFSLITSINYTNADPKRATAWFKENVSNDGARMMISGVKFLIFTKSPHGTFLIITVSDEYEV